MKEYLSEHIIEYLLHEHYDLVEKGCYNRSTKIDLLENWHLDSQHKCVERPVRPVFPDYLFLVTMVKDNNFFWKTIKPFFFSDKGNLRSQIKLIENGELIQNDDKVAETLNTFLKMLYQL